MDRRLVRRSLEDGERTETLLRRLSAECREPWSAAYWLALSKAAGACAGALDELLDRPVDRRGGEGEVPPAEVALALGTLLDAAETLAVQWPHVLVEIAPIEVPTTAYERRRPTRRAAARAAIVQPEDPWREPAPR